MVCDGLSGCTYNIEMHTAEGKKLRDIVVSVFKNKNLCQNHYTYKDNSYNNSV